MTIYTKPTGNAGVMKIEDDGSRFVDFWLLGVNQLVEQIPWTSTLDGYPSSWQTFRLEANVDWQKVATLWVRTSQTVTFNLGASGNGALGGPTEFYVDIERTPVETVGSGITYVKVGDTFVQALPYVNDNGEWKQAQPWGRIAGLWKPAN